MKKKEKECKKSPDGKHCFHNCNPNIYIPGGTNKVEEICCWCGQHHSYEILPLVSYASYTSTEHGPYFQTRVIY